MAKSKLKIIEEIS